VNGNLRSSIKVNRVFFSSSSSFFSSSSFSAKEEPVVEFGLFRFEEEELKEFSVLNLDRLLGCSNRDGLVCSNSLVRSNGDRLRVDVSVSGVVATSSGRRVSNGDWVTSGCDKVTSSSWSK